MSDYLIKAAAKGAALLDSKVPGWEHKIENLNMRSADSCVLGQLFGYYPTGLVALGDPGYFKSFRYDYGFTIDRSFEPDYRWERLQEAWEAEINKRLVQLVV